MSMDRKMKMSEGVSNLIKRQFCFMRQPRIFVFQGGFQSTDERGRIGTIEQGEDIEAFLKREIAKPIIRWLDRPQLGYEVLPDKYGCRLPAAHTR
jgi:hypothetical protein